jgi:hypothetical protein
MAIHENLTTFAGRKVVDWEVDKSIQDPGRAVYRIRTSWDDEESWAEKFMAYIEDPRAGQTEALVIGAWHGDDTATDSSEVVEALVGARETLKNLTHLFFGDIVSEENEISWINQSDLWPLLEAYPNLRHLTVRGGEGLSFGDARHATLRELIVQTGGLRPEVVQEIAAGEFPNLEHLELWLGDPAYGGEATVEDLSPLLMGRNFPKLVYLGLKNSAIADEIAGVVALAPVVNQLKVLDLSMGTLGDEGAEALLASPAIRKLEKLDIHHHFCSEAMVEQLKKLGPAIDTADRQEPYDWGNGEQHRFVAVSE